MLVIWRVDVSVQLSVYSVGSSLYVVIALLCCACDLCYVCAHKSSSCSYGTGNGVKSHFNISNPEDRLDVGVNVGGLVHLG